MEQMDSTRWQRTGSSIIWSPVMLGPLVTAGDATPLRTVLEWMKNGFPDSPPGGRRYVLVGGLQTAVDTLMQASPETAYQWLRGNILPLVRRAYLHWPNVGLVFGMDGPAGMFEQSSADDAVYFGRGKNRAAKVNLSVGIWNGAGTGEGAYQVVLPGTKEVGGYYVQRVS